MVRERWCGVDGVERRGLLSLSRMQREMLQCGVRVGLERRFGGLKRLHKRNYRLSTILLSTFIMSIPTSVPSEILNHPQFQEFLRIMPVAPNLLYMEFLTQAEGSPARLKNLLDSYSQSMAKVPKIGQVRASDIDLQIIFNSNASRLGTRNKALYFP